MARDSVDVALAKAAVPILERLRRYREKAPELGKLCAYLEENLFETHLDSKTAYRKSGTPRSQSLAFAQLTGRTLKPFITDARIEVAQAMLRHTDIDAGTIAAELGYTQYSTFLRAFKQRTGYRNPTDFRRENRAALLWPAARGPDEVLWRTAKEGRLDDSTRGGFFDELVRLNPCMEEEIRERFSRLPSRVVVVDAGVIERHAAEGFWQSISDLPFAEQRREVRGIEFRSTVLFDLLREKSRSEGRKDRQRGIELAQLALVSLERGEEIFGERIHDLRALGCAWHANACRLALDLPAASARFARSDVHWSRPRAAPDETVFAEICNLKGALRLAQRDYDEARRLLDQAWSLFDGIGDSSEKVRVLTQRAVVCGYAGRPQDEVADLQAAARLLREQGDPYLAFSVSGNLAQAFARAGKYRVATRQLEEATELWKDLDYPMGEHELQWTGGYIREGLGHFAAAEGLYAKARAGFAEAEELNRFALTSVDLMFVRAAQERSSGVLDLASETVPILQSLRLHQEALAAIRVLVEAVESENVSPRILRRLRDCLRQDPLASLPQKG